MRAVPTVAATKEDFGAVGMGGTEVVSSDVTALPVAGNDSAPATMAAKGR